MEQNLQPQLSELAKRLNGQLDTGRAIRTVYATDASIYRQLPLAVATAVTAEDIRLLVEFAAAHGVGLIPRAAGTSLAGQTVGSGIVVDVSGMNRVLDIDRENQTVTVQPGVIRDELNRRLAPHGLFFGPETSTSNRAMLGGMLGNNSCGANSIVCGSTRDHVVEVSGFLSDGSYATFGSLDDAGLERILSETNLESKIYHSLIELLQSKEIKDEIDRSFPEPEVSRRNTGYAVDALLTMKPFGGCEPVNLAKIIAGSEGTLFFVTEMKLNCMPPPSERCRLVCVQCDSVNSALRATQAAMEFQPNRCELIDDRVIAGAKRNLGLQQKTGFIAGQPVAILLVEFRDDCAESLATVVKTLVGRLATQLPACDSSVLTDDNAAAAWQVRKAGLGVVANVAGDKKPITLIEDTAVSVDRLPEFIAAVDTFLKSEFDVQCVHYGHAGAGEIHLRPELNLKLPADRQAIRQIAIGVANIVKEFRGSLSGEHGDGLLRSELLPMMLGSKCYELLRQIKLAWDPNNIFNPGKIVDAGRLDQNLRIGPSVPQQPETLLRFSQPGSLLSAVEACSGSGDCRKTQLAGGTMCPSYMATRNEYDTTRARANLLRDLLTNPDVDVAMQDAEAVEEVKGVLDLCLSCKACKSECPSNVDMSRIKAEFMNLYYQQKQPTSVTRRLAEFESTCQMVSKLPLRKYWMKPGGLAEKAAKSFTGIHPDRSLPMIAERSLRARLTMRTPSQKGQGRGQVLLFIDEFTNWIDVEIGYSAVELLEGLGYRVRIVEHADSGRSAISAGLLEPARRFADINVQKLSPLVGQDCKLVGIEPSALLTLRDEYLDLVSPELVQQARQLADHAMLIEEFLVEEFDRGVLKSDVFRSCPEKIMVHDHCHQKALGASGVTERLLQWLPDAEVVALKTGCCGLAGFFGYEREKFELSMQIGELALLPAVRNAGADARIVASGTSCRHQILDGAARRACHALELCYQFLK